MFKFLHAVLHDSPFRRKIVVIPSVPVVFWVYVTVMERRGGDRRVDVSSTERKRRVWRQQGAVISPLRFGCWGGETTLQSWVTRNKGEARPSAVNPLHTHNFLNPD